MARKNIYDLRRVFTPKLIKRLTVSSTELVDQTLTSISGSSLSVTGSETNVTSSFLESPAGSPLKSVQQLPLDFSKFENHTFFSSAEANVNMAFEKIINHFPFDGTSKEYYSFIEGLSGFEKHVLDRFPSYKGYITLDASANQKIVVKDSEGYLFPALSRKHSAKAIVTPDKNSLSIESHVFFPNESFSNMTLFQMLNTDTNVGFSVHADSSTKNNPVNITFMIVSGTNYCSASHKISRKSNNFHHLTFMYDRTESERRALIFSGSRRVAGSDRVLFEDLNTRGADFVIGSGSKINYGRLGSSFTPAQTFTGSINELRVFGSSRTSLELEMNAGRSVFATDNLNLYYRFNEPTGSYTNNSVVLDHSGKSLHSRITNYATTMRSNTAYSRAVATIVVKDSDPANFAGGQRLDITDYLGNMKRYIFKNGAGTSGVAEPTGTAGVTEGSYSGIVIQVNGAGSKNDIRDQILAAIQSTAGQNSTISSVASPDTVTLTQRGAGSSGNTLISTSLAVTRLLLTGFEGGSVDNAGQKYLEFEDEIAHPVLFPSEDRVVSLSEELLTSSSLYDANNPNLITKLIPSHLLDSAAALGEISTNPNGNLMDGLSTAIAKNDFPGGATLGQPQIISSLLFLWAKEFDDLKAMIDHVSNLVFAEYDKEESIADILLPKLAEYYGIELPSMFTGTSNYQFQHGSYIRSEGMAKKALKQVQNEIWRRILANLRTFIKSKGTVAAIKSIMRSSGINPDRYLRFIEYGGNVNSYLGTGREVLQDTGMMLHFSGAFNQSEERIDGSGFALNSPYVKTHYLTAQERVEPGWPTPQLSGYATGSLFIHDAAGVDGVTLGVQDSFGKTINFEIDTNNVQSNAGYVVVRPLAGNPPVNNASNRSIVAESLRKAIKTAFSGTIRAFRTGSQVNLNQLDTSTRKNLGNNSISTSNAAAVSGSGFDNGYGWLNGRSARVSDTLLTSGNWSVEASYTFLDKKDLKNNQSLFRLASTGSGFNGMPLFMNLVADKREKSLKLYYRTSYSTDAPLLVLPLTGTNIFDGNTWYICAARQRPDSVFNNGIKESRIFLRAARQHAGDLLELYTTSSMFQEYNSISDPNALEMMDANYNLTGSMLLIGSQSINTTSNYFLNSRATVTASNARCTNAQGKVTGLRFWSKLLTLEESKEHARSYKSLGVQKPTVNFGFVSTVTGSFQKLRLDLSMDQPITRSNHRGSLSLIDFSQTFTSGAAVANSFKANDKIIRPEVFMHSILSPHIDEAPSQNKIRVIGLSDPFLASEFAMERGPAYQIPAGKNFNEDTRFGIEFSMMRPLDEDIVRLFSSFEYLDNAIGAPENRFSLEYHDLRVLRDVYFNRLVGTMNYSGLFEYFKFLDDSFDEIIEHMIPQKTNYLGFNFIVEGHMLERAKYQYQYGDVYLGDIDRRNLRGNLLLRQLIADIRNF